MRVKLTFSTELEKVLDNLSDQINFAKEKISGIPEVLTLSSGLLKHDTDSGLTTLSLINKSRRTLNDADIILSEISMILDGYLQQMAQIHEESPDVDLEDQILEEK